MQEAFGQVTAWADSRIRLSFPLRVIARKVAPGIAVKQGEALLYFRAPRIVQDLTGYVYGRHKADVAKRWADTLRRNDKGKFVPRHDLLTALQEQATAEAALSAAWDRLYSDLSELGPPPVRKAMDARLKTEADVALLARELSVLHAPFAGVVLNRPPPVGAWVKGDTPLVELERLDRVLISVGIPENALQRWRDGANEASLDDVALPLVRLPGTPGIDVATGLRVIRFRAENLEGRLQDGQWIRVRHRGPPHKVLWVPEAGVVSRDGRAWCLVLGKKGPVPIAVETGPAEQGQIPVLSGLKPDQPVVVEGAYEWLYRDLKNLIRFVD